VSSGETEPFTDYPLGPESPLFAYLAAGYTAHLLCDAHSATGKWTEQADVTPKRQIQFPSTLGGERKSWIAVCAIGT